jgi:Protein of unknown function with HXXEE motif
LSVEWSDFYVTNAIVIAFGVAHAELAPALPFAPLTFASLMLISAVFFHILPVLRTRGRFSPGVVTAVILFFPAGLAVWWRAGQDGVELDHSGIGHRRRCLAEGLSHRHVEPTRPAVFSAGAKQVSGDSNPGWWTPELQ